MALAAAPPHTLPALTILARQRPICQLPCALRMEEGPDLGRPGCLVQDFRFLCWRFPLQKKEHQWYRRGEEASSCNWQAEDAPLPRGDFRVTTIFINARRHKKWQQVNIFFPSF